MDIKGCLTLIIGIFAFYSIASAIAGILVILDGDYGNALPLFYPFFFLVLIIIVFLIYNKYVIAPREMLERSLRKMHHYPQFLLHEDGEQWGKAFQRTIGSAIENITEKDKKSDLQQSGRIVRKIAFKKKMSDLQQCERIVRKMAQNKSFDNLHRAFRLTGCHMEIKDSTGNSIVKIV